MDIRAALKEQYHAGLAMLRQCTELCPEDMWTEGTHPRPYWRIVWHTLYFTHNYLVQTADDFNNSLPEWPEPIRTALRIPADGRAQDVEPYELPEGVPAVSREETLAYCAYVDGLVDTTVDGLDLDRDSGFPWYEGIGKLSHQLMNVRHIQGHVGQLSELLMARSPEVEVEWVAKA